MYTPTLEEFLKLSKKGNIIPVYREMNADLDTPVSAFLKIKKNDYAFLLESVEGQEKIARYSFLGTNPSLIFKSKGRSIEIIYPFKNTRKKFLTDLSPLDEIKKVMLKFKSVYVKGLPRFFGGLVGFIGYDMVRFFERLPDKNPDDLKTPDSLLILTDTLLVFDHFNHTIKIISNVILPDGGYPAVFDRRVPRLLRGEKKKFYQDALNKIDKIYSDFNNPVIGKRSLGGGGHKLKVSSNFKKREFEDVVRAAKEYIKKGDIIQVVPSQRFKVKTDQDPFMVYRTLRSINPSPYMYFLKLKELTLVGTSPEMLVRCEDGVIQTRPIAGTRPRGKNELEDKRLASQLIKDKKERAEHLMLVDLGRNDLGRVSKIGTVKVSEFMNIEKYSHVMHLVSEVKGILDNKRYDIYDVLKAVFPAGTVSGSPKIRAMELIDELENTRRGPYAGCVGYFSFSHNMDTCITIRTILIKGRTAYVQAGGGIVADSRPEKEYIETVNKAQALIEAIKQ
ncbi:MAG: anthranilate synthase component I [Candidatus Omnitrophica bacterium CG08_land_8_20_14_0_20_41_16]|uniref:Anthranilate synthase component 1 n=1 Tax=Candidatus Sherwoodlollariibacterium unditelluris TaxID=1974757 RepID=A0A2G9YM36_9BACT|nr:MAG: anthranilate synthase component I [Candidatus Omnitrophica bacterium CG23_combo_of_CG06-09_8_20_14_all_41_10]PIS33662.1 MAG: anthranilate synthase component I [Candidatus Omnitrophica bacterium CG08_land_8_20_14_0_20_41_16]